MHDYTKTACQYVEHALGSTYGEDMSGNRSTAASSKGPSPRKPEESVLFTDIVKASDFGSKALADERSHPRLLALDGEHREGWRERSRERAAIAKEHAEDVASPT